VIESAWSLIASRNTNSSSDRYDSSFDNVQLVVVVVQCETQLTVRV
jgi:hypothetical protein